MMAGTKGGVAERKQRKRPNSQSELGRSQSGSGSANDSIRLQALGAHVQALGRPIDQGANALNVRIPPAVGTNVRVRHALAEAGSLTAHVTNGSHDVLLGFSYTISCLDLEDQEAIGDRSPQATMTPYLISPQITKSTGGNMRVRWHTCVWARNNVIIPFNPQQYVTRRRSKDKWCL